MVVAADVQEAQIWCGRRIRQRFLGVLGLPRRRVSLVTSSATRDGCSSRRAGGSDLVRSADPAAVYRSPGVAGNESEPRHLLRYTEERSSVSSCLSVSSTPACAQRLEARLLPAMDGGADG